MIAVLGVADDLLVALVAVPAGLGAIGWIRQSVHRPAPAHGDAELARLIDQLRSPFTRRLAVTVVDVRGSSPSLRSAFIDCTRATRFEIGSVTKGLTGLLVADAVARGEVDLTAPVADYLPALEGSAAGRATLAQLASHRSGLPRLPRSSFLIAGACSYLFGVDSYARQQIPRLMRTARRCRTNAVGTRRYSNLGAALAGQAVAGAAGRPFAALMAERIFQPLGMAETTTDRAGAVARGWRKHGRRSFPWRMGAYAPAGGVVSTSRDMALLVRALLTRRAPGGCAVGWPGTGPGLFWLTDESEGPGRRRVWHNGETGGYSAFCAVYPQSGCGVLVLANRADAADLERLVKEVSAWLLPSARAGE